MSDETEQANPLSPWIGSRGRIGVVIPSTNIGVEYDCQRFAVPGMTWHFARFYVDFKAPLSSDEAFLGFLSDIHETIPLAMRDLRTVEIDHIMMGISVETFWDGVKGNEVFQEKLREQMNDDVGLTIGANAVDAALRKFGAKTISVVSPYQPVGEKEVHRFFTESGYEVKTNIGLKCPDANAIAHTPREAVVDLVVNQLDGDDVDAIVQVGTNMSNSDLFPTLEKLLGKPVIPLNVATIWHAYRALGIDDKLYGYGRLFEEF